MKSFKIVPETDQYASMGMAVAATVCGQKEKNRLPALVQRQFGWSHANQWTCLAGDVRPASVAVEHLVQRLGRGCEILDLYVTKYIEKNLKEIKSGDKISDEALARILTEY